jgi:hypothetical protein
MELDLRDRDQEQAEELAEALVGVAWAAHGLALDRAGTAFAQPAEM